MTKDESLQTIIIAELRDELERTVERLHYAKTAWPAHLESFIVAAVPLLDPELVVDAEGTDVICRNLRTRLVTLGNLHSEVATLTQRIVLYETRIGRAGKPGYDMHGYYIPTPVAGAGRKVFMAEDKWNDLVTKIDALGAGLPPKKAREFARLKADIRKEVGLNE